MLSMRRFICTFCYKSIFFFQKGAVRGKKFTLQNVFCSFLIIKVGEACKKCSVYVTIKLLKLCISVNILVTFVAVEECFGFMFCAPL